MRFLQSKTFWFSLLPSGVITYWVFWLQIPAIQSGDPGVDGVVKEGWPIVETSGGCNMVGSCVDFSYTFFAIDIFILAVITTLLAYNAFCTAKNIWEQPQESSKGLISNILTYLSNWLIILTFVTIAIIFSAKGVSEVSQYQIVSNLPTVCILASLIYNFYYFKDKFVVNWGLLRGVIYLIGWPATLMLAGNIAGPLYSTAIMLLWTIVFHVAFFWDALYSKQ